MKNILILGSGRSGTSMVAGTLAKAGYFMGDQLLPPNNANPKGFFEDIEVNAINEAILATVAPKRPKFLGNFFFRHIPLPYQRWLLALPLGKIPFSDPLIDERIKKIVAHQPYCLKDPRFSYTLPVWQPFLKNTVFLVVFREPMATATSIAKECKDDSRLHSLEMNTDRALEVWDCMYSHILKMADKKKNWLFLHFDQVLTQQGCEHIREFTGAEVDFTFPEKRLKRSITAETAPESVSKVYSKLCNLAGYSKVPG